MGNQECRGDHRASRRSRARGRPAAGGGSQVRDRGVVVFMSLFPQYMLSWARASREGASGRAPGAARDGTAMQRAAFDAVSLLDDKPGVCAAIDADLRPDAKQWALSAEAVAHMKDACVASLAKTIDFVLARMAAATITWRFSVATTPCSISMRRPARRFQKRSARRARRRPNGSARTSTRRQRSSASPQRRSPSEPSLCRPPSRAATA